MFSWPCDFLVCIVWLTHQVTVSNPVLLQKSDTAQCHLRKNFNPRPWRRLVNLAAYSGQLFLMERYGELSWGPSRIIFNEMVVFWYFSRSLERNIECCPVTMVGRSCEKVPGHTYCFLKEVLHLERPTAGYWGSTASLMPLLYIVDALWCACWPYREIFMQNSPQTPY